MISFNQFIEYEASGKQLPEAFSITEAFEHPFSGPDMLKFNPDDVSHPIHNLIDTIRKTHTFGKENFYDDNDSPEVADRLKRIRRYTKDSSGLNGYLLERYHEPHNHDPISEFDEEASKLDQIATMHRTPVDMHVYSGTTFSPLRYHHNPSDPVIRLHLPAFTSTSISHESIMGHAHPDKTMMLRYNGEQLHDADNNPVPISNVAHNSLIHNMLKIHVPQGTRAAYVADHSAYQSERELLLPRNVKLHVHPQPTLHAFGDGARDVPTHVWHAKLVHDGTEPTRHYNEDA